MPFAMSDSVPVRAALEASPLGTTGKASANWLPLVVHESCCLMALPSVQAFEASFPALRFPAVSLLSDECLNRAGRLPASTMPSADFCTAVREPHDSLSLSETPCRSPEVSSTAFCAQPPDLRFTPLMDIDFAIPRPLVRRWRLLSDSCSSARAFARRLLQTPPHDDALALC